MAPIPAIDGIRATLHRRPGPAPPATEPSAAGSDGWLATRTSRRGLLKYGAAGAVGSTALSRWAFDARAETTGLLSFRLAVRDGPVRMIDGTNVYMWGYGPEDPSDDALFHRSFDEPPFSAPFTVPGPTIIVSQDRAFEIRISNSLDEAHGFAIFAPQPDSGLDAPGFDKPNILFRATSGTTLDIPPGNVGTLTVGAWELTPGTYLYGDPLNFPVNRVLGLNGALIVRPKDDNPVNGIHFIHDEPWMRERLWVLNDIDPAISMAVQANKFPTPAAFKSLFWPRYFTIGGMRIPRAEGVEREEDSEFALPPPKVPVNVLVPSAGGKSGRDSVLNEETVLKAEVGQPTLLRILHGGLACHSLHWHANHVIVLTDSCGGPFCQNMEKDVVVARSGAGKDVIFPFHAPLDATTELWKQVNQTYPMHCHAEMSQTAAGGLYPNGMLGHIEFDTGKHCTTISS